MEQNTKILDILMVCYNQLESTKDAIESLTRTTDPSKYRLFVIDNSPNNETQDWFQSELDGWLKGVEIEYHRFDNIGWIKGIHAVYPRLSAPFFLTCHNDVIFSEGWLDGMMKQFRLDPKIAMVGPVSNFILGIQSTQYNMPGLASEYAKFICGLFCIFKASAVQELIAVDGYFMDERFGLGDKEEHDYAIRLANLGYKFRIARNVYIEHVGEKGFIEALGSKEEFTKLQNGNLDKLIEKWGNETVDKLFEVHLMDRQSVVIAVPVRGDYVHRKHHASMVMLQKSIGFQYVDCARFIIDEARNKLVEYALEQNATHVLFIDDDMIFPPEAAIQLLNHDVDIVTGLAFRRKAPYHPCIFRTDGKDIYAIESINKGLVPIDCCGSAFILIKTEVFKRMPKPWYVYADKSFGIYADQGGLGEDMSFTLKAKNLGFDVMCDTDLIITHLGDNEEIDADTYMKYKLTHPESQGKQDPGIIKENRKVAMGVR